MKRSRWSFMGWGVTFVAWFSRAERIAGGLVRELGYFLFGFGEPSYLGAERCLDEALDFLAEQRGAEGLGDEEGGIFKAVVVADGELAA